MRLTVGKLKELLEGCPDDIEVEILNSNDQEKRIISRANRINYQISDEVIDYFEICIK